MQGTAADIIKRAMIDVDGWLGEGDFDAVMVMQVHDELIFEVKSDQVEAFRTEVVERMQRAGRLDVPLKVEAGAGDSREEAH